jgi:hypothetical protein
MFKRLRKLIPTEDDALLYEFSPQRMTKNTIEILRLSRDDRGLGIFRFEE